MDTAVPSPLAVAGAMIWGDCAVRDDEPWWAAQWLVDGHDGPALRELAGLGRRDTNEIRDLLPTALAECGAPVVDLNIDSIRGALRDLAGIRLGDGISPRGLAAALVQLWEDGEEWMWWRETLPVIARPPDEGWQPDWDVLVDEVCAFHLDDSRTAIELLRLFARLHLAGLISAARFTHAIAYLALPDGPHPGRAVVDAATHGTPLTDEAVRTACVAIVGTNPR